MRCTVHPVVPPLLDYAIEYDSHFVVAICRGVRPCITTFNTLIAAASDSSSYGALLEVGEWLRRSDAEVRSNCMNSYVSGLVKVGWGRLWVRVN